MTDDRHRRAAEMLADGHAQVEVADEVGVSSRTVRRWKKAGKLDGLAGEEEPDSTAGGPDRGAAVGPSANGGDPSTLSEARRRKEAALAAKHELDAGERAGTLIHRDHLRDALLVARRAIQSAAAVLLQDAAELLEVEPREAQPLLEELADRVVAHVRVEITEWVEDGAARHGLDLEEADDAA